MIEYKQPIKEVSTYDPHPYPPYPYPLYRDGQGACAKGGGGQRLGSRGQRARDGIPPYQYSIFIGLLLSNG